MRRRLALLLLLPLAACGTTQSAMPYTPAARPAPVAGARPVVTVGTVVDQRRDGREDPNWIGTIRGGYGNPLKRLESNGPVRDVVAAAFRDGLAARGLLAPEGAGRYELGVTIIRFDASQYVRREATAEFRVTLAPRGGAPVWTDTVTSRQVDGSALSLSTGVFADVEDLRRTALRAMSDAVDQALDKPGLAAALR